MQPQNFFPLRPKRRRDGNTIRSKTEQKSRRKTKSSKNKYQQSDILRADCLGLSFLVLGG